MNTSHVIRASASHHQPTVIRASGYQHTDSRVIRAGDVSHNTNVVHSAVGGYLDGAHGATRVISSGHVDPHHGASRVISSGDHHSGASRVISSGQHLGIPATHVTS